MVVIEAVYVVVKSTVWHHTDLGWTSKSATYKTQRKIFRLNFPNCEIGITILTLLVVLYVVLNTNKAIGT